MQGVDRGGVTASVLYVSFHVHMHLHRPMVSKDRTWAAVFARTEQPNTPLVV
jgi:hypothetical protein